MMVTRRSLRLECHVERMKDSCLPNFLLVCKPSSGKRSAGRQKRRWNDVLMENLEKCDLLWDRKETAQDRGAWRCFVMDATTDLSDHMERQENESKDVR